MPAAPWKFLPSLITWRIAWLGVHYSFTIHKFATLSISNNLLRSGAIDKEPVWIRNECQAGKWNRSSTFSKQSTCTKSNTGTCEPFYRGLTCTFFSGIASQIGAACRKPLSSVVDKSGYWAAAGQEYQWGRVDRQYSHWNADHDASAQAIE